MNCDCFIGVIDCSTTKYMQNKEKEWKEDGCGYPPLMSGFVELACGFNSTYAFQIHKCIKCPNMYWGLTAPCTSWDYMCSQFLLGCIYGLSGKDNNYSNISVH